MTDHFDLEKQEHRVTTDVWKHSPFAPGAASGQQRSEKGEFDDLELEEKVDRLAGVVQRQAELIEELADAQAKSQQADLSARSGAGSAKTWDNSPFAPR